MGSIRLETLPENIDWSIAEENIVRCPDVSTSEKMQKRIEVIKKRGDTIGGKITCTY